MLIVDGHPVHKLKKVMRYIESQEGWLEIVFLPPDAPGCIGLESYKTNWNQSETAEEK
ncbi:transposase [Gynuella sunshinyii]|uniref:transposase n=1 Tax=Gynuella sunshinyii TaxID=1445505 RepID=UPI001184C0F0